MLTIKAATALLAADGAESLTGIAAVCGYQTPPLPLALRDRDALGLRAIETGPILSAHIARGPGALRALLIRLDGEPTAPALPELVARVATKLARDAPHLAWLCIASAAGRPPSADRAATSAGPGGAGVRGHRQLILATWAGDRRPPRIAALVVDPDAVVDSDAETLAALAASAGPDSGSTHARWLDLLGRESLTRRFYRALDRGVRELASTLIVPPAVRRATADARQSVALLYASRLLFLAFLEAKGWLDGDRAFLSRTVMRCLADRGGVHQRVLRPLFFGTLNTATRKRAAAALTFGRVPFLNGGLFSPTPLERRLGAATFTDAALGTFIGDLLGHYRFTAREDRSTWSEAAIDPEMLGKAFEALIAPAVRHATGAYYTPQVLVARITDEALLEALTEADLPAPLVASLLREEPVDGPTASRLRHRLRDLRVLDPACGSGAFLVHALDVLARLAGCVGDRRPPSERRRSVLTRSIFGVDINPTAVWLCDLRLWLAVLIDSHETDPAALVPLPNLDRNIRVGDALTGGGFERPVSASIRSPTPCAGRALTRLRERYARAVGPGKREASRSLERAERRRAVEGLERDLARVTRQRRDAVTLARSRDLFGAPARPGTGDRSRRAELRQRARALRAQIHALRDGAALPFAFAAHFGDVDDAGGFDLVLGNPPWVRPHALPVTVRERQRRDFVVCRNGSWSRGTTAARAGPGFGTQVDVAALFVERALTLTRPSGIVALLLPAKLWRALAGGGVRRLVMEQADILRIEDWSTDRAPFDAATYPSLLVLRRARETKPGPTESTTEPRDVAKA